MKNLKNNFLGVYEKALPAGEWETKFITAKELGFDFIEMSIDESDSRLSRLDWNDNEILKINNLVDKHKVFIRSICFSGQRRYPMGSHDPHIRETSMQLLEKCIKLAIKLNVRLIQLAGYDVFYEEKDDNTRKWFLQNLQAGIDMANRYGINLSIEIMDDVFMNSITKFLEIKKIVNSPWLSVYPDLGNLVAWNQENSITELEKGFNEIVALHIKDTLPVSKTSKGKFKNVEFGTGTVNFEGLFKYLLEKQYSGSFVIEAWYEDFDQTKTRLAKAKKYILDIFEKSGWEIC